MSIIAGYGCFKYVIRFFVKNVFIVTPPPHGLLWQTCVVTHVSV